MTLANRRALYRVRNHFTGLGGLIGFAAVLVLIGLITMIAHEILGR
jgi:hypothetical protein